MSQSQPQTQSQAYNDELFEPTQLSQPAFSQTQGTYLANSQVEPRRKYWAVFISTHADRSILKIPWTKAFIQIGRGPLPLSKNDVILPEKRVSNTHCRFTLGVHGPNGSGTSGATIQAWKDGEAEPEVNGVRVTIRRMLQHGDEVSIGHPGTLDNHDVRYIYRSVGAKGSKFGATVSKGGIETVGEVYERYQLLERLGKGTFAEVRRAVDVETGDMRAVKQIVKHRFSGNDKTLQLFHREIDISRTLQHENICRLIDWYEDPQHICLVLEYIDGGDLLDHIMNWPDPSGLPETHAAELSVQICRAMAYTHGMGITHRDLKPENILLAKEAGGSRTIKIADFGLAKMIHANTMLVSMVGTPQYLAPEVVMQTKHKPGYENVVDSWSVGIIVYSMMTKALPFDEDGDLPVEQRIKGRFVQPADTELLLRYGVSAQAIDFILRLLEKEPDNRMTMAQALQHQWLAEPSASQAAESQQHGLGGDSMWSIKEFSSADPPLEVNREVQGDLWDRPMTVSGTNLESVGASGSDDFSQPMDNLHINTSCASLTPLQPVVPEFQGTGRDQDTAALSPSQCDHHDTPGLTVAPPAATVSTIETPLQKRKHSSDRYCDMFSSGSLSDLPSQENQQDSGKSESELQLSSQHILANHVPSDPKPVVLSDNATPKAKLAGTEKSVPIVTRRSPRTSNRPRKSMRLS
ncbi:hypothetical protein IAT38_004764 [Cryptococcus sp. DSM 104549]